MIPVLLAQIVALATDGAGGQLRYLANYQPQGIYEQGSPAPLPSPRPEGQELTAPYLSSDGQAAGWSSYTPCRTGSCGMFALPRAAFTLQRHGELKTFHGFDVWPSRNGRYLLQTSVPLPEYPGTLTNLETGARTPVRVHSWSARRSVSDEGDVIGSILNSPLEYGVQDRAGNIRRFTAPEQISSLAISANGKAHAIVTQHNGKLTLRPVGYESEQEILFEMSADGSRILVASGNELLLYDGALRTLARYDHRVQAIALSDNGRVAYASTAVGAVERYDIDADVREAILAPFVSGLRVGGSASRGSALRLHVPGVTPDTRFRLNDVVLHVIDIVGFDVYVQLPWELHPSQFHQLTVERDDYPFRLLSTLFVWDRVAPYIMPLEGEYMKAAQQDFTNLVSPGSPAPAGSTIHAWLTGLGPLDREVAEGEPGPSDPPARPLAPLACYIRNEVTPPVGLELPFVAYAPGLVGVYQVDMRIPQNWPAGEHFINCESIDGPGANLARISTR